jgi:hypothetical protein
LKKDKICQKITKHAFLRFGKKNSYVSDVLNTGNANLALDPERVQEIAAKNDRVLRSVNRVDPAGGYEEGVADLERDPFTLLDFVSEESFALLARQRPLLVLAEVVLGRWDEEEHLDEKKKQIDG